MQIGLMGAGFVGEALAKRLTDLGHSVKVANSRGAASLTEFSRRTGAAAVDIDDISSGVEFLVIAIPLARVRDIPPRALASLPAGAVVIDAGNYVPMRDGVITEIEDGMAETAWVSAQLNVPLVKAFNSITAFGLAHHGKPKGAKDRIALPVAGDDAKSRAKVARLLEEMGFTPYDTGALAESWRQQPGQPAYCTDGTISELPKLLARANRATGPSNRDKAMATMAKLPTNYSPTELIKVARLSIGLDKAKPASWLAMARLLVTLTIANKK